MQQKPNASGRQIVASFYYSFREGEQQTNHSNMLRSVLYDILDQNEEFFFHFQRYHRERGGNPWSSSSLGKILLSIAENHPVDERLYLIVDAMDESVDGGRGSIIGLLEKMCATKRPCVVKVFVASRPIAGLSAKNHKMIRLEEANAPDILIYAESFLSKLRLPPDIIRQAREYIDQKAQGVFVWVYLVLEELRKYAEGRTQNEIFDFLGRLPTELKGFYERILTQLESGIRRDIRVGHRVLRFVLFTYRPLELEELRQALAVGDSLDAAHPVSDASLEGNLIFEIGNRLVSCTGNFLQIKGVHGSSFLWSALLELLELFTDESAEGSSVQIMHQTVREFFRSDGPTAQSRFRMKRNEAHIRISATCIQYLLLCIANTSSIDHQAGRNSWKPENFEACAHYLKRRPFFNYALGYIKQHLMECSQFVRDSELASQLCPKLNESRAAVHLFGNWIPQDWGQRVVTHEELDHGKQFRAALLHTATRLKYSQVVEGLLIAGAEVDSCLDGKTPLIISAEGGDLATARVLLDQGADIGKQDGDKRTALHLAAANGHSPAAKLLLQRGADKEAKDIIGWTALHLAAASGHHTVTGLLIDQAADKEAKDNLGWTLLHLAAANGHSLLAKRLIDQGADKEAKDREGQTALHLAAANGHRLVAELLIDQGCDKEAKDREGQAGLHIAAANGDNPTIRLFIDKHASKEAKDDLGWEALHTAAWAGHEATIRELQTLGANKEARDTSGWTALHVSVVNGRHATSRWLIEHLSVDKRAKDDNGWTALHFAAALGLKDIVLLLLESLRDVDRDAQNKMGKTALDLARE